MAALTDSGTVDEARLAWDATFLGDLPKKLSDALFTVSRVVELEAAASAFCGIEPSCFVVVDGLVRVFLKSREGREATIRYATSGDAVGLPPVIAGTMDVWGEALTDARLIRVPADRFRALAQSEVTLAWAIARHLALMMINANETLGADVFLSVRARVARHLLDLAHREGDALLVTAPHQEIANAIGSVREVVSREMRRFAEAGLLARTPRGSLLLKPAELHQIASGP